MRKSTYPKILTLYFALLSIALISSCDDSTEANTVADVISIEDYYKDLVKTSVVINAKALGTISANQVTSEDHRKDFYQIFIENIRFLQDDSGYFFIEDMSANMIAHAVKPELIGQNRYDVQDSKGKYYVREMIQVLESDGGGYVDYYFLSPATQEESRKTAFVKTIPGTNYFIGSGFYEPHEAWSIEIKESSKEFVKSIVHTSATALASIFSSWANQSGYIEFYNDYITDNFFFDDNSGYFFLYNIDGTCVHHPIQRDIEGTNRIGHTDSQGKLYIKEMCNIVTNGTGGFVEYHKINFSTQNEEIKTSYVERIPGTDLFIGAGVYFKQ